MQVNPSDEKMLSLSPSLPLSLSPWFTLQIRHSSMIGIIMKDFQNDAQK